MQGTLRASRKIFAQDFSGTRRDLILLGCKSISELWHQHHLLKVGGELFFFFFNPLLTH